MQDIHSIGGGGGAAGTLFGGGGGGGGSGGGDRRLRLTNHHNFSHLHHPHHHNQALKCPRCDSLNTKFCYYNNYNLSQPRHFCKSCRRYWTKGGVLRNVPVGGGCRKSKRSSKPRSSTTTTSSSISATISPPPPPQLTQPTSNSHSSSESSSLTATTNMNTNTNTSTAVEAVSGYSSSLNGVVGGRLGPTGLGFEPNECGIFPDMGSSFASLMTTSANETSVPFGFSNLLNPSHHHQEQRQLWNQEDQTAEVVGMQKGSGGFGALDWQASGEGVGDQVFFDLPVISGVDQGYWSQSQWTTDQDHDHSNLYLP